MYAWMLGLALFLNLVMFSAGLFLGVRWLRRGRRAWAYGSVMAVFVVLFSCYAWYQVHVCAAAGRELCWAYRRVGSVVFAMSTLNFAVVEAFLVFFDSRVLTDS